MSVYDDCVDYAESYMDQDDLSDNGSECVDSKADKRAHHNALERKRRDHIKDSFSSLRDAIPLLHGEKINSHKASRAQILKKAAEYIDHMRRKNNDHQKDIDILKRENKLLENKIRTLEEMKMNGNLGTNNVNRNKASSTSLINKTIINNKSKKISKTNDNHQQNINTDLVHSSNRIKNGCSTLISETKFSHEKNSLLKSNKDLKILNKETLVQIVKKEQSYNESSGTTILMPVSSSNGSSSKQMKQQILNQKIKKNSLLGVPLIKRKRLNGVTIITSNTSIISK